MSGSGLPSVRNTVASSEIFLTIWGLVQDLAAYQRVLASTERKVHPADFSGSVGGGGLSRDGRQRTETVNLKTGSVKHWGEGRPPQTYHRHMSDAGQAQG